MNKKLHIQNLDGIRAIAALMVMFFHFFQNLEVLSPFTILLKDISSIGQTGISLFFVLSGFLITRILISNKTTGNFFLNFYARRSLRIFPLYYLYLIIVFFIVPLLSHTSFPDFNKQIYHWIYLQDFALTFNWNYEGPVHFWSLAVEEHFYMFFPFLIYFLKDKYYIVSIYIIIALSIITRYFLNTEGYSVFYFTITRMDELALGALLAILETKGKLSVKHSFIFVYLFIFSVTLTVFFRYIYSTSTIPILHALKFTIFSLKYFAIIGYVICLKDNVVTRKILTGNFLIYSGKISYGLYVYHPLCFYILSSNLPIDNLLLKFLAHFSLTYLISSISFYYFESKFLIFKKNFANKLEIKSSIQ